MFPLAPFPPSRDGVPRSPRCLAHIRRYQRKKSNLNATLSISQVWEQTGCVRNGAVSRFFAPADLGSQRCRRGYAVGRPETWTLLRRRVLGVCTFQSGPSRSLSASFLWRPSARPTGPRRPRTSRNEDVRVHTAAHLGQCSIRLACKWPKLVDLFCSLFARTVDLEWGVGACMPSLCASIGG